MLQDVCVSFSVLPFWYSLSRRMIKILQLITGIWHSDHEGGDPDSCSTSVCTHLTFYDTWDPLRGSRASGHVHGKGQAVVKYVCICCRGKDYFNNILLIKSRFFSFNLYLISLASPLVKGFSFGFVWLLQDGGQVAWQVWKDFDESNLQRSKVNLTLVWRFFCIMILELHHCYHDVSSEMRTSSIVICREREKEGPGKYWQNILSPGITCKEGENRHLGTAQWWDAKTADRLLPPSRNGPSGWRQRAVFWIRVSLITEEPADREGGFKGGNREIGRAKRGPGKDECQLFLQSLHLRLLASSLHPAPPPSSSAAAQGLLRQRKTPLMAQTERSVCVLRTESLSLDCPWIHVTSALSMLLLCSLFVSFPIT